MNLFHKAPGLRIYVKIFQLVAALATVCSGAAAQVLPSPTKPMWSPGAFNIRKNLPAEFSPAGFQVHEVVGRGGTLTFLVSAGPSRSDCFILQTDLYGGYKTTIRLDPGDIRNIDVDTKGDVHVLFATPKSHTAEYDQGGKLLQDSDAPGSKTLRFVPGLGITHLLSNGTTLPADSGRRMPVRYSLVDPPSDAQRPTHFGTVGIAGARLTVFEGVTATMETGDMMTGVTRLFQLRGPEIDSARMANVGDGGPGLSPIILVAAAADAIGDIYFLVGGYKDDEGATIIRVDPEGNRRNAYHCMLPPNDCGSGKVMPAALTITDGKLFISGFSGVVAAYYLEP